LGLAPSSRVGLLKGLKMVIEIGVGQFRISPEDARLAVAGYAFGTREIRPSPKAFSGAFEQELASRWGYRTYDCIPASEDNEFTDLDILVAAGLNGRLGVDSVAALKLATGRAAESVAAAAKAVAVAARAANDGASLSFADLASDELGGDPPEGTIGAFLAQAWRQMMSTPGVGVALTHKVLHHKQPEIFPLLDNLTTGKLSARPVGRTAWQQIHLEVAASREDFESLRSWFAELAAARGGVAVSLTRLYDILLWLKAKEGNEWEAALKAGRGLPPL
jgi:hypothetical protein